MTTTQPRRFGFKRWIVTALIVLGAILGYGLFGVSPIFKPIAPAVVLPAEPIWPGLQILPGLAFTNTLLATLVADVIVLLLGFVAWRFVTSGKLVPSGLYHIVELLVEFGNGLGRRPGARRIDGFAFLIDGDDVQLGGPIGQWRPGGTADQRDETQSGGKTHRISRLK